jgi:hypothetical protein
MRGSKVTSLFLLIVGIVAFVLILGYFVKFTTPVMIAVWGVIGSAIFFMRKRIA